MTRYGLPYKGSKNKIAEKIIARLPQRKNFYDLFCGGCAVTHCAMVVNKWENYFINDLDAGMPQLFYDAIYGKYANEKRWISREDFFNLKDTDPYIKICWSFGNNGADYMYSKEVEHWKKALHYARVLNDFSLLKEMGIDSDGSRIDIKKHSDEFKEKYIQWAIKYFKFTAEELNSYNELKAKGVFDGLIWGSVAEKQLRKRLQSLESLQRLQSLQSLESLQRLQRLQSLQKTSLDYRKVNILPDSVIYCDIPYKDTDGYTCGDFDHNAFYEWCGQQKELVVISSYKMPESDFVCFYEMEHRQTLGMGATDSKVIERLFVPKHQAQVVNKVYRFKQLELFEDIA